jgi:hypothetical protein
MLFPRQLFLQGVSIREHSRFVIECKLSRDWPLHHTDRRRRHRPFTAAICAGHLFVCVDMMRHALPKAPPYHFSGRRAYVYVDVRAATASYSVDCSSREYATGIVDRAGRK